MNVEMLVEAGPKLKFYILYSNLLSQRPCFYGTEMSISNSQSNCNYTFFIEILQIKKSYILIIIIIHSRQTLMPASMRFINPRKCNIDPECKAEGSMIPWDNKSFQIGHLTNEDYRRSYSVYNLDSCGRSQSEHSIYIKPDIQQVFECHSLLDCSMIQLLYQQYTQLE